MHRLYRNEPFPHAHPRVPGSGPLKSPPGGSRPDARPRSAEPGPNCPAVGHVLESRGGQRHHRASMRQTGAEDSKPSSSGARQGGAREDRQWTVFFVFQKIWRAPPFCPRVTSRLAVDGMLIVMKDGIKDEGTEDKGSSTHDDHKGFIWTDCHFSLLPCLEG